MLTRGKIYLCDAEPARVRHTLLAAIVRKLITKATDVKREETNNNASSNEYAIVDSCFVGKTNINHISETRKCEQVAV